MRLGEAQDVKVGDGRARRKSSSSKNLEVGDSGRRSGLAPLSSITRKIMWVCMLKLSIRYANMQD
jgi:hypothetical protein